MHHPGEVVAGFRIERLLGSGGMGEVYLVHHPRLPRLDALKLLPTATSADHTYRERFQREADLAARLDHDNVVTVYDRGEADGQLWIHMKYVPGEDAAAALRKGGPFTATRALHTITRVAAALDDAHHHELLHRDVKPANILLGIPAIAGDPERIYLTDFGIAKGVGEAADLTPSGHFAASLDYASPEQIQVQKLDGRSDQYALGCVLFQLLTGSVPYPGEGAWARMNAHLTASVPRVGQLRPGLPPAVQAVIDRALAKNPEQRFESCGAMAAALSTALRGWAEEPQTVSLPPAVSAPPAGVRVFSPPRELAAAGVSSHPRESVLPGPRPPDISETPAPQPAVGAPTPPPATAPLSQDPRSGSTRQQPPTPSGPRASTPGPPQPAHPLPEPPAPWWHQVDRAAAGSLFAALVLIVLTALPPSSSLTSSPFPAEIGTGRFVGGLLPALVLVLVAGGLQLTRHGHRLRPLICAVALGAGAFTAVDSLRVYAYTQANPGGAYSNAYAEANGTLARAIFSLIVVSFALTGVLRPPPRPKPRPSPHALVALLLSAVAVMLAVVAVIIGPVIQRPRLHQLIYGIPLASTLAAAALLALAVWTRRLPLLVASATVAGCAFLGSLSAADPLKYPMGILADAFLLAGAGILLIAARRPTVPMPPPAAGRLSWPPPSTAFRR